MIYVRNLRTDYFDRSVPYHVKVDRSSILGNPFKMISEVKRDEVCDKYEKYFEAAMVQNEKFNQEFMRLVKIYREHGRLELFCWCAPKRCHAETISKRIIQIK